MDKWTQANAGSYSSGSGDQDKKDASTQTYEQATKRFRNEDGSTKATKQSDGTVTIAIKKK